MPETKRIAEPEGLCEHVDAMNWMNTLVINLKQQLLGFKLTGTISMQRLDEWDKHYEDLEKCRRPRKVE